ncbi:MAG: M23 family metallopeptidase [Ekhidna sp.]
MGQEIEPIEYQFPINPGQQNYLAGTVGEIRSSHFHTGIDIKTGGRTGLPVYAVADGFISRLKVSATGYGNTIYLQHPNGTFSVYAHLEAFDPQVEEWILKQQYLKESFDVDLFPEQDQFAFNKGDVIGYSGNSGSSSGPHLHFEIRDQFHQPIDVLSLGFKEIRDRIPPVVKKIAFVSLSKDARINGFFGRQEFDLTKKEGYYTTSVPVHLKGKIGIEIYSYDPMDGIPNKNGIVKTALLVDGDTLFSELKKVLSFSKQRNTLVHYNYEAYKKGSKRFNKLYLSDGNEQTFYKKINRGVTFISQKRITIVTTDSYENQSLTKISLSREIPETKPWVPEMEVFENFIHFRSNQPVSILLSEWKSLTPYLTSGEDKYYIWDMRDGLPKSVFLNGETTETFFAGTIPSNQKISYVQKEFEMELTNRSLFDTLHLVFEKEYDSARNLELFHFKNHTQPLRSSLSITLKPDKMYHYDAAIYSVFGKRFNYMGGVWESENISFETRDLVTYTILRDSIPPKITPRVINQNDLKFRISDDLSGIKSFRAEINGQFVLMYYEPKRDLIWSKKLDKNIPFEGELILTVEDNSNNITTFTQQL